MTRLQDHGFECYKVGGAVRDYLLGIENLDIDLTTSASPDILVGLFSDAEVQTVGKQFGVVLIDGIEVATFRGEQYEIPGKPRVHGVVSFAEDASRRDFTINAMAMDQQGRILDPFGGKADLEQKLIRTVGDPALRFREDPVRIIRGIGFAARLGFALEIETKNAMSSHKDLLISVPKNRIGKELQKMCKANCLSSGLRLIEELGLLQIVIPQMGHLPSAQQNPKYHHLNAWEHSLAVLAFTEHLESKNQSEDLKLAALFHDCAKGLPGIRAYHEKSKQPSDHGHDEKSTSLADEVMTQWAISKPVKRSALFLIKHHMLLPNSEKPQDLISFLNDLAADFSIIEDFHSHLNKLYWMKRADIHGKALPNRDGDVDHLNEIWELLELIIATIPFYRYQTQIQAQDFMETGEALGLRLQQSLLEEQDRLTRTTEWIERFEQAKKGEQKA